MLIITTASWHAVAGEQPTSSDFTGFYLGAHYSKSDAKATATKPGASPYSIKTDSNNLNSGFLIGYNHAFDNILVGFEYSQQGDIATDRASTEWAGKVVYSDLKEQKARIGYQFDNILPYIFYGTGDLKISWSGYLNSDPNPLAIKLLASGLITNLQRTFLLALRFQMPVSKYTTRQITGQRTLI